MIIVDKAPFNITQCDQVIQYEAETFVNNTDYSKRKPYTDSEIGKENLCLYKTEYRNYPHQSGKRWRRFYGNSKTETMERIFENK